MGEPARHTGSPRRTCRGPRWAARRRLGTAALGAALALLTTAATSGPALAGPVTRDAFATVSPDFPLTVTVSDVATGGGTLTVHGKVANGGSNTVGHPHVGLKLGGRQSLPTRSDIAALLGRTDPSDADGTELKAPQQQLNELRPGTSADYALTVKLSDLKLDHNGVYELAVDAEDDSENVLGIARTLLPYFPEPKDINTTQVSTVWPLTHAPELVAQTTTDDQSPVLRDDKDLVAELSPGGRLDQLVKTGATIPSLTWAIDPDLLDTVFAMTKPYRVQQAKHAGETARLENTTAGTGQAVAGAWLDKLRAAVAANGAEVLALPYADPDLASIAHNGSGLAGLETALGKARTAGKVTVEGRLSVDVKDNVAWPYQGYLDQQIAGTAQRLGDSVVLVNGASLPDPSSLKYAPNAARPIGNGLTAVVADTTIAGVFQSDLASPESQSQAKQRFLAETLAITLQHPGTPRTLLVMPSRTLSAGSAQTLAASLAAARDGGWTSPATLSTVAAAPADAKASTAVPPAAAYPGDVRASELPAAEFAKVSDMQQHVDQLLRILTNPQRVSGPFSAAMVRSVSTQWRDGQQAGGDFRSNVQKYLKELTDAVAIPAKSQITTMPGDSGLLQVSVKNGLTQTVTNLEVKLISGQPNRLRVDSTSVQVSLEAGRSTSVVFPAQKAAGNGLVPMTAQLWTVGPDAAPYGPEVKFQVEVTNVPSGVWWVVGAGAVLVLLAGIRIYLKRKNRTEEDEDPDAPLELPGEADLAAQP